VSVARPFGFGEKKKRRIRKAPEQKKKKKKKKEAGQVTGESLNPSRKWILIVVVFQDAPDIKKRWLGCLLGNQQ
jgi:hypothetical protein